MSRQSVKMLKVILLASLLLGAGGSTPALALDQEKAITQYVHDVWQIEDGLPSNVIPAIVQTRDGYLWLAAEGGLVRFDGVRFTVFKYPARTLYEDREGTLWIGSRTGLIRYKDGRFITYTSKDGVSDEAVETICEDREGNLWLGTFHGELAVLKNGAFTHYSEKEGWIPHSVSAICTDRQGVLWIGTGRGLTQFKGGKFITYTVNDGLTHHNVRAIYEDRAGNLWIGATGGLTRFTDGTFTPYTTRDGLSHNDVRAIYEDRAGNLWIGTYGGGLNRFRDGRFDRFTTKEGLSDDRILTICEDHEGSLWIGTYGGGLNRLKDGKVTTYTAQEGLSHDWAYTICGDREGGLWIGTKGGGLNRLKNGRFTIYTTEAGLPHDPVRAVFEDRAGNLWIGTYGGGLIRYRNGAFTRYTTQDGLSDDRVRSIYEDREARLWIGTQAGLHLFKDGTFTPYLGEHDQEYSLVYSILEDREGSLWIGTRDGLFRLKEGHSTHYTSRDGLSGFLVMSLYEDPEGTLWIGTYGGGLNRFKAGQFTGYTEKEGLFDSIVYQILEDGQANLWMSGNKGIFRVSKQELNNFAEGKTRSIHCTAYGKTDGMKAIECSGAHQPAGWKTRDGSLWFPTVKGVVMIDPENMRTNQLPPPVHIEQVIIDKNSIVRGDRPEVPPGKGDFEFHYTALSFLDPSKVRFKYTLEGYDQDWVDAETRRVAYYTNLPPGEYRFRVMACNNDGVWNESGTSFEFYLSPHFYQTKAFYTLCAVILALLGPSIYLLRVRQLKARQRELASLVQQRTKDLEELNQTLEQRVQQGIKALADAERMAAYGQLVTGVAHEVRNPLFALQTAAYVIQRQCGKARGRLGVESQLKLIGRESKRISSLMNELLDFARPKPLLLAPTDLGKLLQDVVETCQAEHKADSPKIILNANPSLPPIVIDRNRMLQVLINLIGNAAKHAKGLTTVTLCVDLMDESQLCIRVKDDGAGIAPEYLPKIFEPFFTTGKGTGLGLAIVQRIVEEHGGTIQVQSEPGRGTVFTICLPAHRKDAKDAKI